MSSAPPFSNSFLLGQDESPLVSVPQLQCQLHHAVVEPLAQLCDSARAGGFCISVASSFRSFERQLHIWNAKATGQRPVLDAAGNTLELAALDDWQKVQAILRWSALPGASRHHWGTDLDIYDSSALTADYRLQLTPEECQQGGPFAAFHCWLDEAIATRQSFGFFRPYDVDRGGVAPEPWHLSYAPLSNLCVRGHNEELLRQQIERTDIALKATILAHLPELYQRFVALPHHE